MEIGIIIVSDRGFSGERLDKTGPVMLEYLIGKGYQTYFKLIPDEIMMIEEAISAFSQEQQIDLIITCGGSGCSPRDVTPEATKKLIEREIPGFSELIRYRCGEKIPFAYLSRGISGIINGTIIVNLPGSPNGALESFQVIEPLLDHAVDQVRNMGKYH